MMNFKHNKLNFLASKHSPTLRIKSSSSNFRASASLAILFCGVESNWKISKNEKQKTKNNKSYHLYIDKLINLKLTLFLKDSLTCRPRLLNKGAHNVAF